jgi:hypothetical protein
MDQLDLGYGFRASTIRSAGLVLGGVDPASIQWN